MHRIIINANGDPRRFADTGLTVVADTVPDFAGPLAGIAGRSRLAGEAEERHRVDCQRPGDCPFLPDDLVERLHQARRNMGAGVPLACARLRRMASSGSWCMAAGVARGFAQSTGRGAPAQNRGLDRATWRRCC